MWNSISASKGATEKKVYEAQFLHVNNILNAKSLINNKAPKFPEFLKRKDKNSKLNNIINRQIQIENDCLLQKMINIERKPGPLDRKSISRSLTHSALLQNAGSEVKLRLKKQVETENKIMLNKLNQQVSLYDHTKMKKRNDKLRYLSNAIKENAVSNIQWNLPTSKNIQYLQQNGLIKSFQKHDFKEIVKINADLYKSQSQFRLSQSQFRPSTAYS